MNVGRIIGAGGHWCVQKSDGRCLKAIKELVIRTAGPLREGRSSTELALRHGHDRPIAFSFQSSVGSHAV